MSDFDSTNESVWLPVVEFPEHYAVSHEGLVRRSHIYRNRRNKDHLKPLLINSGYFIVNLNVKFKCYHRLIHRLVAEAFIGPIPSRFEVNHKNGCKADNRASNLEIVSCRDNHLHAIETGLCRMCGTDNPMAKVTEEFVRAIRRDYQPRRFGPMRLARRYGVSLGLVESIIYGHNWAWLDAADRIGGHGKGEDGATNGS